jgi:sirohydrochlorin cobaltochelatase
MTGEKTRGLLLVAHGSSTDSETGEPARRQARAIASLGVFDEVEAAFWKEEPSLRDGLTVVKADEVFVVPFFISSGYYTEELVPREMEIKPGLNLRDGRRIYYTPPVGTHAAMTEVLLHQAESELSRSGVEPAEVSLFIVGHGTEKNKNSSAAVHQQVAAIRQLGKFAEVQPAFMEEEPTHKTILSRAGFEKVLIIPFFISDGPHSRRDIPADIGLARRGEEWKNPVILGGKMIWYTRSVGSDPRMVDVILERVKQAEAAG